jgi:hypothetical protein
MPVTLHRDRDAIDLFACCLCVCLSVCLLASFGLALLAMALAGLAMPLQGEGIHTWMGGAVARTVQRCVDAVAACWLAELLSFWAIDLGFFSAGALDLRRSCGLLTAVPLVLSCLAGALAGWAFSSREPVGRFVHGAGGCSATDAPGCCCCCRRRSAAARAIAARVPTSRSSAPSLTRSGGTCANAR